MKSLILASASPRRRELLSRMGIPHTCKTANVDETADGPAREQALLLALRKAKAIANPGAIVIGADTLVEANGIVLGKPRDEAEARVMLQTLSGNWHDVYTGVAIVSKDYEDVAVEHTRVRFVPMSDAEIADYIATGDPMDKAGAYGVQGYAGQFIDRIEGCYYNVMGLPTALLRKMLKKADAI